LNGKGVTMIKGSILYLVFISIILFFGYYFSINKYQFNVPNLETICGFLILIVFLYTLLNIISMVGNKTEHPLEK